MGSADPGAIEDELGKWEDLANWNSSVGSVWSRLADYHDTLTAQVEEHRRTLRILAGRPPRPEDLAHLEAALTESVVFQPELATDRSRLEAVAQALVGDAEALLRDARLMVVMKDVDEVLVTFERVSNARVRAAWQALRAHRDDVAETCEQLRALIEKTVGCGDDGRVLAVLTEAEPYADELGQVWQALRQYADGMRVEGTRELRALLQVRPGEDGDDAEGAVLGMVDAALARYQHSMDPDILVLWSELCVHRAALRGETTGAAALMMRPTVPIRGAPAPPGGVVPRGQFGFSTGGAGFESPRELTEGPEQRELRKHIRSWAGLGSPTPSCAGADMSGVPLIDHAPILGDDRDALRQRVEAQRTRDHGELRQQKEAVSQQQQWQGDRRRQGAGASPPGSAGRVS